MIEAALRRYGAPRHLRHLDPIEIDSSFDDMSLGSESNDVTGREDSSATRRSSSSSSTEPSSEELGGEIIVNIDAVPVACCCVGVVIGHALRCGGTAETQFFTPFNTFMCALLTYWLFSDCCTDVLASEMDQLIVAIATAASAHTAELQPVRDISDLALPSYPYDSQNSGMEPTCSVCQEDFEPNEAVCHLYCGHTFHPACIYKWALYKDDCPMCRTKLESRRVDVHSDENNSSQLSLE